MILPVYNQQIEKVFDINISDKWFNLKFNPALVHQVYTSMKSNERKNIAHTKGRGEVRGGGRKPWAQKHTGRARHGSIRSPLWKGGGVVGGPLKEKNYKKKINKKMSRLAILMTFIKKINDNEVFIFENFKLDKIKTKLVSEIISKFREKILKNKNANSFSKIFILEEKNDIFSKSARNLPKTRIIIWNNLNIKDLLDFKYIFISKEALEKFLAKYE